jgi:hypothetical protein
MVVVLLAMLGLGLPLAVWLAEPHMCKAWGRCERKAPDVIHCSIERLVSGRKESHEVSFTGATAVRADGRSVVADTPSGPVVVLPDMHCEAGARLVAAKVAESLPPYRQRYLFEVGGPSEGLLKAIVIAPLTALFTLLVCLPFLLWRVDIEVDRSRRVLRLANVLGFFPLSSKEIALDDLLDLVVIPPAYKRPAKLYLRSKGNASETLATGDMASLVNKKREVETLLGLNSTGQAQTHQARVPSC